MKRSGFTVLELLVASLLLSMLVTMLTMIFNQSSIAWRTGIAGVADLSVARMQLGTLHDIQDDVLPHLGRSDTYKTVEYRTVSIFKNWNGGASLQGNKRLYEQVNWGNRGRNFNIDDARDGKVIQLDSGDYDKPGSSFVVGVRSKGPDKKWNTADDINTFPEEVD